MIPVLALGKIKGAMRIFEWEWCEVHGSLKEERWLITCQSLPLSSSWQQWQEWFPYTHRILVGENNFGEVFFDTEGFQEWITSAKWKPPNLVSGLFIHKWRCLGYRSTERRRVGIRESVRGLFPTFIYWIFTAVSLPWFSAISKYNIQ